MSLLDALATLTRRLVPASCPRCRLAAASGFCPACRADFVRIPSPCPRCGLASPCRPCPAAAGAWPIDAVVAPFAYAAPLARQLLALKYARQRHLGAALGLLLAAEPGLGRCPVDALVPVPLHPRRLRQRSFNQADEIARPIARATGLPIIVRGIRRRRYTQPQTALDRRQRRANPRRAFAIDNASLRGLRLAIVDDVITTAATVNALATALRSAGAVSVVAWAVARTPDGTDECGQSTLKT